MSWAKHHIVSSVWQNTLITNYKVLHNAAEILFQYKIKYCKQICMLFVNKINNTIRNTGKTFEKCII